MRRTAKQASVAAMILLTSTMLVAAACQRPRPVGIPGGNLVLIVVDTLRADHLGCYGYSRPTSPNIDALAKSGVLFSQAMAQATTTSPSHASIFTGLGPYRHGLRMMGSRLDERNETLAEILKRQGYRTAAFVSATPVKRTSGLDQGFDVYDEPTESRRRQADETTKQALAWLRELGSVRFFLWIHYFDPHFPYAPPKPYDRLFLPAQDSPLTAGELARYRSPSKEPPPGRIKKGAIALYDGEIAYVDAHVGKLMREIDTRGETEKTLVVFTSDHGECLGDHGYYFRHRDVYQPTVQVPLLISHPRRSLQNRKVSEVVRSIDILPTILDILGLPVPDGLEGSSLRPLLLGESAQPRTAYSEHVEHALPFGRSLRDSRWKFIDRHKKGGVSPGPPRPQRELYDLRTDPDEQVNLASREPKIVEQLQAKLKNLSKETEAPSLTSKIDRKTAAQLRALGYYVP